MISRECRFSEFVGAVRGKDYYEVMQLAELEATAAEPVATAKPVAAEITRGRKTVIPAAKRIEAIFAETVALVAAAPASPTTLQSHRAER